LINQLYKRLQRKEAEMIQVKFATMKGLIELVQYKIYAIAFKVNSFERKVH